jgi:group I intron endonuclease
MVTPKASLLEILEYCTKENAISREQYYLDLLNPEYNILKIAGSRLGFKHSEETLLKMSGKNNPMFGKNHSEETIAKISGARKGKSHSEETRKKCLMLKKDS